MKDGPIMLTKNGSKETVSISVEFVVGGLNDYQQSKNINEFLRHSLREFGATYNVADFEVKDDKCGCIFSGRRDNNIEQGELF